MFQVLFKVPCYPSGSVTVLTQRILIALGLCSDSEHLETGRVKMKMAYISHMYTRGTELWCLIPLRCFRAAERNSGCNAGA